MQPMILPLINWWAQIQAEVLEFSSVISPPTLTSTVSWPLHPLSMYGMSVHLSGVMRRHSVYFSRQLYEKERCTHQGTAVQNCQEVRYSQLRFVVSVLFLKNLFAFPEGCLVGWWLLATANKSNQLSTHTGYRCVLCDSWYFSLWCSFIVNTDVCPHNDNSSATSGAEVSWIR